MVAGYNNEEKKEGKGGPDEVNGINAGPFVVPAGQVVTSIPTGTLIPLDTDPTLLPTTPLSDRKWIRFRNEDLVDIQLCDSEGNVFRTLEPGEESPAYIAPASIGFYGKVASGTADVGVRVEEGK
jgi:hypothetical protein